MSNEPAGSQPSGGVEVSRLLSDQGINDFSALLEHYMVVDDGFSACVDGGAGLGETAEKILEATNDHVRVVAYEPNKNNVASFSVRSERLHLVDAALGSRNGVQKFVVSSNTSHEGDNPFLKLGTSFVGKLAEDADATSGAFSEVEVVRLDTSLSDLHMDRVDFVKLDLQGGEKSAIEGLGEYIQRVKWMWVEFGGQEGLLELLSDAGFTIFDTEYLFVGQPTPLIEELFTITRVGTNSIGKGIFFGFRRHSWKKYKRTFDFMRKHRRMIQTDLVAVNNRYLPLFHDALSSYLTNSSRASRVQLPDIIGGLQ